MNKETIMFYIFAISLSVISIAIAFHIKLNASFILFGSIGVFCVVFLLFKIFEKRSKK